MKLINIHLESIDSTNAYAKRIQNIFAMDQIICITADEQSAGYGRKKRKWFSPKGLNLYTTFCFWLPIPCPQLSCIPYILALSLASLLQEEGLQPQIKWPNDVLIQQKKIAGILCETDFETTRIKVILGIGINLNMEQTDLNRIDQPATSVKIETNQSINRNNFLQKLQNHFLPLLEHFKKSGFSPFYNTVNALLAYKGQLVHYFDGKKNGTAICESIAPDGRLNLRLKNNQVHPIISGEIFP